MVTISVPRGGPLGRRSASGGGTRGAASGRAAAVCLAAALAAGVAAAVRLAPAFGFAARAFGAAADFLAAAFGAAAFVAVAFGAAALLAVAFGAAAFVLAGAAFVAFGAAAFGAVAAPARRAPPMRVGRVAARLPSTLGAACGLCGLLRLLLCGLFGHGFRGGTRFIPRSHLDGVQSMRNEAFSLVDFKKYSA